MKKLWKMLKNRRKDNRGLSLVELVCTVAIFSVVATAVGGVMVVSAQNYQRGTNEINLQQEAQIAVNQIADLVIDATAEVTYTGTPETPGADGTLQIKQGSNMYEVTFQAATQKLYYSEYTLDGNGAVVDTVVSNELMAENITDFRADASQFGQNGILKLKIGLAKSDRTYASDFTITSRNGGRTITYTDSTVTISAPSEIVLEPNQKYLLSATVTGASDTGVNWVLAGNTQVGTQILVEPTGTYLKIDNDETASELTLLAQSNVKREDGVTPMAQQTVTVHIRRVNSISLSVTLESGTAYQAGAVYRIDAVFPDTNLDKFTGLTSDDDYINPRKVTWETVYSVDGKEVGGPDHAWETPDKYYIAYDVTDTSMRIKLVQNYGDNHHLVVTAVATHPDGENKVTAQTGVNTPYGHVFDIYAFSKPFFAYNGANMYRGTNIEQGSLYRDSIRTAIEAEYNALNVWNNELVRYYRYREIVSINPSTGERIYGPWTNWTQCTSADGSDSGSSINIRPAITQRFELDKDYELQIRFYAYKDDVTNIMWPFADTPEEANTIDAELRRVVLKFDISSLGLTAVRSLGTKDAPQPVSSGDTTDFLLVIETPQEWGYDIQNHQNDLLMKVEKLDGDTWVPVEASDCTENFNKSIGQKSFITWNNPGVYRVIVGYSASYSRYNYETKTYSYEDRDYWLGNETNGDDIFYFEVH